MKLRLRLPAKPLQAPPPEPPKPRYRPNLSTAATNRALEQAPAPPPTKTEVAILDGLTPGRSDLEAFCHETGQSWGLVKISTTTGNGRMQSKAYVIVGTLYEVAEDGDVDDCLRTLTEQLRGSLEA